jgi:hypothetical protein
MRGQWGKTQVGEIWGWHRFWGGESSDVITARENRVVKSETVVSCTDMENVCAFDSRKKDTRSTAEKSAFACINCNKDVCECVNVHEASDSCFITNAFSNTSANIFDTKNYSFLHWNVNGLLSKLSDHEFIEYISSFDFICLVETFVEHFQSTLFDDHTIVVKPAVKLTERARRSGGVVCLIRNNLMKYVRQVTVECDNVLMFIIDKNVFHLRKDIVYVCTYIPPEKSPYYSVFDVDNGICQIEDCLADFVFVLMKSQY